jgi:hypothetical protein
MESKTWQFTVILEDSSDKTSFKDHLEHSGTIKEIYHPLSLPMSLYTLVPCVPLVLHEQL